MARQVIEKLVDDLDGSDAAETVSFGLDGTDYEIDLSKKNAAALRKSLEQYRKVARRVTARSNSRSKATAARPQRQQQQDFDIVHLREWAGNNGVEVPTRGRIPRSIVDQYKAAGGR